MEQLDTCYTGQASNFKCLHSKKSIEIASQILKEKEAEYKEAHKFQFDCFFKEAALCSRVPERRNLRQDPPEAVKGSIS